MGTLSTDQYSEIVSLIHKVKLPEIQFDNGKIFNGIKKDKKRKNGNNNFILLNNIGNSYIAENLDDQLVKDSISTL